ncbi:MAG: SLC13 family permease [Rhodobacteraceae bacterium]|uniref:SLC13 family permease n=1 Tax=Amaricoccus sp. TaxID=1872485 RepID=UPI001D721E61|nr:SLC13 family permease [Amaricoccus sp.]MCB1374122.1 SLC13 family permease [Paracoccaceae bacterium]MCC0066817.1 SLC13 family permease [Rhodovulum sp.]HRW15507.1 SLC13 family permease [Amaricoccus sp.]
MTDIWIVFAIIACVIALFVWDRLPVIAVCVGCAMALWATGVLTLNQALAGFGDPATVFVTSLFVVSGALEKTGLTAWTGQVLARGAGDSRFRLIVLMMLFCGVLSALISVNGAVAALLPVVVVLAVRLKRPPSQLLMPLVFGAHSGSMLALTGTPVNVLVLEASLDAGERGFGYFEFAYVGVFLVIGTIILALLLGTRLLPVRENRALPPDLSRHARTLVEQFRLDSDVHQLRVRPESPLVGRPRAELAFDGSPGVSLLTVQEAAGSGAARLGAIEAGDLIALRADADDVAELAADLMLSPADAEGVKFEAGLFTTASGLAEVIIPPRSPLIGERLFPGMVTPSGNLVVLALQRQGIDLAPGQPLKKGDTLLLQGTWEALGTYIAPPEALVVDSPELVRRQVVPMGRNAAISLGIMAVMVVLLATGVVPAAAAGILAAGAVLLFGILNVEEIYRSINWTTVILVGAMMPLSTAITQTGAAKLMATYLIDAVGGFGPRALLAGLFILTGALGQVISNTATALIIIPISVVAAEQMGVSPQPVLMSVAVAAAASFLTPVATPTNLMVMEPGGYRFGDYWKFGLPMMLWFFLMAVFVVPLIWPF